MINHTDCSSDAMDHYRLLSIRESLAHWAENACLRRFRDRQKESLAPAIDRVRDVAVSMRRRLTDSRHQSFIQIPITQAITLAAVAHPAVSSLEVCRTPAR